MYKKLIIILSLLTLGACGEEVKKTEPKAEAPQIEPFLAPVVEKVVGGEDLKGEKAAVRDLVVNYNKAVLESQINMEKLGNLKRITTKSEYTRMYASLEKDRTDNRIMSCTLREIEFKEINVDKGKSVVKTREEWLFEDRELKTGKKLAPFKNFEYEVQYTIVKQGGRWVVGGIDINKAMEFVPPRGTPARARAIPYYDR